MSNTTSTSPIWPSKRSAEVTDEHLRNVGQQVADPFAGLDPRCLKGPRQTRRLRRELPVGDPPLAVDDADLVREDLRGPLEKSQRSQGAEETSCSMG